MVFDDGEPLPKMCIFVKRSGFDLWTHDIENATTVIWNCDKFYENSPCIPETGEQMPPQVLI